MSVEVIGNVEKIHEETGVYWNVANFFSVAKNKDTVNSPIFSFVGISWQLQLKFKSENKPGFICLYLMKKGELECSVNYNFQLKKLDGTFEYLSSGILNGKTEWIIHYINLSDIQLRKTELTASDMLIIKCSLKLETSHSDQMLDIPKLEELIKLDTLSENFKSLMSNGESCDATLLVKEKEYKVHRSVLIARSSVFSAMFLHETSEKQTGIVTISDCDPETFSEFLEFLYTGKLKKPSSRSALHLYETSDKYDIQELKIFCSEFLIQNLTLEDFFDVVILADKYEDKKLLSGVQSFFNKNLNKIFETAGWDSLMTNNCRLAKKLLIEMSKIKEVN